MTDLIADVMVAGWLALGFGTPPQDARPVEPVVTIVSPGEGSYVSGPTLLLLTVAPLDQIASVVFQADGKQVCAVTRPPFQCNWDAGPTVVEHQIRAVVTRAGGAPRIVRTSRTRGVPQYTEAVDVDVVQVTAAVMKDGRFVHGLSASAFSVFEDGTRQTITTFSDSNQPLDLIVAVDMSGSMADSVPMLKAAVREFLTAIPGKDSVTLLGFNDEIFSLARKATDSATRLDAVERITSSGLTALYDVIVRSVDLLGRGAGRKAIVIFTDGEDQGSHVTLDAAERRLQESDATLFMIGQGRGTKLDSLKKVMQRLAAPTGGRAIFTDKIDQLKDTFKDLLEELANQYLIAYPPTNEKRDGTWRTIKVQVDGYPQVRARQGYRARGGG